MAHTNYRVPRYSDGVDHVNIEVLKLKAKEWESYAQSLLRDIEGIYDSIKEHGYATLSNGKETIRIVEDKEDGV